MLSNLSLSEVFLKDEDFEVVMKFQIGEIKQQKKVKNRNRDMETSVSFVKLL